MPSASDRQNGHALLSLMSSRRASTGHTVSVSRHVITHTFSTLTLSIQNALRPAPRSRSRIVPPPTAVTVARIIAPSTPMSLPTAVSVPENAKTTVPNRSMRRSKLSTELSSTCHPPRTASAAATRTGRCRGNGAAMSDPIGLIVVRGGEQVCKL